MIRQILVKIPLITTENKCKKVQNPCYKDVTLNSYTLCINKPSCLKFIIIEQCVGVLFLISSDSYLKLWINGQNSTDSWRTTHYFNGQSPWNKASKIQKLAFRCFLLNISKREEISRLRLINKALTLQFFCN